MREVSAWQAWPGVPRGFFSEGPGIITTSFSRDPANEIKDCNQPCDSIREMFAFFFLSRSFAGSTFLLGWFICLPLCSTNEPCGESSDLQICQSGLRMYICFPSFFSEQHDFYLGSCSTIWLYVDICCTPAKSLLISTTTHEHGYKVHFLMLWW